MADVLGCCCETCEICSERTTDRDVWKKKSMDDMGYVEERAPDEYEIKSAIEKSQRKEEMDYQSEEEQTKVRDLVSKRQKTSLMYISNITLLPQERIIEIILDDPDFIIEYEYVVNKKFLVKEEVTKKLCPICKTPYEPSHEFCSNCGNILN